MSKLNLNNKSFNFFKNNKIKCLAMMGVIITSLSMCSPITTKKTSKLIALKYSVENNLDYIKVVKDLDNKCYNITEYSKEQFDEYIHYTISFEEANELNIDKLLDKKTVNKIKKKEWIN